MNVKNIKLYSKEDLVKKVKKVVLLNSEKKGKPQLVYKKADVSIEEVPVEDLLFFQRYKLTSSQTLVKTLSDIFQQEFNFDFLHLKGYVTYTSDEKRFALIPPVVEYVEIDGKLRPVVLDGIHRTALAKELGHKTILVISIKNIPENLAFPAKPNEWSEIELLDAAPEPDKKRNWLIPYEEGYDFYRNFQSVFTNIGKPRVSKHQK